MTNVIEENDIQFLDLNWFKDSDETDQTIYSGFSIRLAPYAKESYVLKALKPKKEICQVIGLQIKHKNRPKDLYSNLVEVWKSHRFDNIAGAAQKLTEDLACELVENAIEENDVSRVVLGGGIAINIEMNQAISGLSSVSEIYVGGSNGNESLRISACYVLEQRDLIKQPLGNLYLGYNVDQEINELSPSELRKSFVVEVDPTYEQVAQFLFEGRIIGWIQGRAEFGTRALRNRSILAKPSFRESVQKINEAIKNRDF